MANSRTANVIFVDTTAAFTGPLSICGIKYIGAASGTLAITATDSGSNLYQEAGTPNLPVDNVEIFAQGGITVAVTNSAKCYIYLEA